MIDGCVFMIISNTKVTNIHLSSLKLLNAAWALMLHKGAGRIRALSKSLRYISSCPIFSKALDTVMGYIHGDKWEEVSSPH